MDIYFEKDSVTVSAKKIKEKHIKKVYSLFKEITEFQDDEKDTNSSIGFKNE